MKKIRKCDICNDTSDRVRVSFSSKYNLFLCAKHYGQLRNHGEIIDKTKSHKEKTNTIKIRKNYAEIIIFNKHTQQNERILIDLDDVDRVKQHKWYLNIQPTRYYYTTVHAYIDKKEVKLSRFILNYDGPDVVDHINRNSFDNRKQNLRIITATENKQNVSPEGVYKTKSGRWKAYFQRNNIQYTIGTYDTKLDAQTARKYILKAFNNELKTSNAKKTKKEIKDS